MARVLLIEDEILIALAAQAVLEEAGHTVLGPVDRVRDALDLAASEAVDLAVVDMSLAGRRTGAEAASELGAKGIPSVFATSRHGLARDNADRALGLLPKPYSGDALLGAVEAALALSRGERPPSPPRTLEIFKDAAA